MDAMPHYHRCSLSKHFFYEPGSRGAQSMPHHRRSQELVEGDAQSVFSCLNLGIWATVALSFLFDK